MSAQSWATDEAPLSDLSKLKICLITSKHPIRDSRIYGCFYRGIAGAGAQVTIIGPFTDENDRSGDIRSICLPVRCAASEETLGSLRLVLSRLVALSCLFYWCLRLRPDIIQACEPDSWIVAWLAARLTGRRAVFDVHEMYPAWLTRKFPRMLRHRGEALLLMVFRWLLRRADAVFHVSAERQEYYSASSGSQFVVPSYPSAEIAALPALNRDQQPTDLVHLGRIVEIECRRMLLAALARCQEAKRPVSALIVGQTHEEFATGLLPQELAPVAHHLRFEPPVSHDKALMIASAARIGIALYDPRGAARNIVASRKLYEYMALGLPVIGTTVSGINALIERHRIGFTIPLDSEQFAIAILRLLGEPGLLEKCGVASRSAFDHFYNWESQHASLMRIYQQLANSSN